MTKFVFEIDRHELACRLAEAALGMARPPGMTGRQAMEDLKKYDADVAQRYYRAATAAARYMAEVVAVDGRVN